MVDRLKVEKRSCVEDGCDDEERIGRADMRWSQNGWGWKGPLGVT